MNVFHRPHAFKRVRTTRGAPSEVAVVLSTGERELLAELLDDVARLLEPDDVAVPPEDAPGSGSEPASESEDDAARRLLEDAFAAPVPDDPALARLLPEGSREDAEAAAGFRRLTEHGLRRHKQDAAALAAAALRRDEPVQLRAEEAGALLTAMNDVRLVLAERIGLRTDEDAATLHHALAAVPDEDTSPWVGAARIYEALTWWLEELLAALPRS